MISLKNAARILPVALLASCGGGAQPGYVPGLGEIMSLQQMRHSKLWLAGKAANWELAAYETDELEEGFADVMRFHPMHKSSPAPLTSMIPALMDPPIQAVRSAIESKDAVQFGVAFQELTSQCNDCHQATGFGFNVVVEPTTNPFANQDFRIRGE